MLDERASAFCEIAGPFAMGSAVFKAYVPDNDGFSPSSCDRDCRNRSSFQKRRVFSDSSSGEHVRQAMVNVDRICHGHPPALRTQQSIEDSEIKNPAFPGHGKNDAGHGRLFNRPVRAKARILFIYAALRLYFRLCAPLSSPQS